MNLRFTPSALALALTLSATSVAPTNVDANVASGPLADRFSGGDGEKKKNEARRRAERMFPLEKSDDVGGAAFVAGSSYEFDAADTGILGRRRLNRNRLLFGGGIGHRSLNRNDGEGATCIKPDTCEPSLCNCTANGGSGYDCAAELEAVCNNVTAADGTVFTIEDCVSRSYVPYYYNLYCPYAKCVVDGGTKEECSCEFYKRSCELYDKERFKVRRCCRHLSGRGSEGRDFLFVLHSFARTVKSY